MIILGTWGLSILPSSCTNNELFTDLRIMIVSAAVTLTFVLCTTICAKLCYKGDMETGIVFPTLLLSIGILQISMIVRVSILIDDCTPGQDTGSYRNFLGVCGGLSAISVIYGSWRFYRWMKPAKKKKSEDPIEIEAKIRRRQLRIRSLEEKLERSKSTKHAVKYNRRLDRNMAKLEKLEEKLEEIEGEKEFIDENRDIAPVVSTSKPTPKPIVVNAAQPIKVKRHKRGVKRLAVAPPAIQPVAVVPSIPVAPPVAQQPAFLSPPAPLFAKPISPGKRRRKETSRRLRNELE